MKIRLIADRSGGTGGYTLGNKYFIFDESETKYFIVDDNGQLRFISKSLIGTCWDWEIVE